MYQRLPRLILLILLLLLIIIIIIILILLGRFEIVYHLKRQKNNILAPMTPR